MLEGIDLSKYNGTAWSRDGLAFMFARATYGATVDPRYSAHVRRARSTGMVVGAYCFGVGFETAAAQAAAFLRASRGAELLILDLETDPHKSMSNEQARDFIARVHASGHRIGLYHSRSRFPTTLGQDFNWVAQWGDRPPMGLPWAFWQYQGHPLDRDRFNGDLAALHKLAGRPA